ncbi:MAG: quinohemoprotein ethanol dehydrogenase [Halioglobus sp.]|jgi:quinohemoprotein ethanol dehydrogenase
MRQKIRETTLSVLWFLLIGLCVGATQSIAFSGGPPDEAENRTAIEQEHQKRVNAAEQEQGNWLLHGRTYSEQRFSPLKKINDKNVTDLGYALSFDLNAARGLEATPIMRDGVLYISSTWSVVYAIDARTGKELWMYDPQVPRGWGVKGCCDVVNRGVAIWGEQVFSATFDGRLIALNAKTGKLLWETNTIDRSKSATITGAPRVVNGKVIIGNAGAEFDVRGYVSAYDVANGELVWRFYTVPKSTQGPHEHPELELAAKTWSAEGEWRKTGGGGTVWDSLAFDPELNLLYVGTGNGAPHARHKRSPGGGDNLYLSSILALDADTGEMKWYYQTTPGDSWDFTATQHMILAEVNIDGAVRKVLMQAPKNGFFYVLDRETGELLSAEKFVAVNWASHVDLETRRPVETGQGEYAEEEKLVFPSELGGHNWHPMSYSPETKLVYIPALEKGWIHSSDNFYMFDFNLPAHIEKLREGQPQVDEGGYLKAWDPIKQKLVWQIKNNNYINGGVLSTAGNLVFQGTQDGYLNAYNATSGKQLLNLFLGTGVIAPPISYMLDGEQYIAVLAGFGGVTLFMMDDTAAAQKYENSGRLIVLKLNGGNVPVPAKVARTVVSTVPESAASKSQWDANEIKRGEQLYIPNCGFCHGMYGSKSILPDLTKMSPEIQSIFKQIVLDGVLEAKGMAGFSGRLDAKDTDAILQYLLYQREEQRAQAK